MDSQERPRGISEEEAARRLAEEGYNELPSARARSLFVIAVEVMKEPMFLLLVAGGGLYILLGDIEEALLLLGFVFVVIGITLFQERKTERTLEALRDLSSPRALVVRDGHKKRIAGREVVRGDLVLLQEGDRVPADASVLSATNLAVDESLLTGESVPVRKVGAPEPETMESPGGEDLPFVYSGTLVVQGTGVARVLAIGAATEMGKIGRSLERVVPEETHLHRVTARLVRTLALVGASLCLLVVIVYGLTRGDWLHGLLAGITLAMAVLPEEFPVVLTVFLALGAWRIARKHVLTRQLPSVETLGSATVLCVDKTGTLTRNRMSVREVAADGYALAVEGADLSPDTVPEPVRELVRYGVLASQADPFDPTERAIHALGARLGVCGQTRPDWVLVREYPLSKSLLSLSHVWRPAEEGGCVIATKGAPEAIADLCHLGPEQTQEVSRRAAAMARQGLRVLGVARGRHDGEDSALPDGQHDFDLDFLGLLGLADPVRPGAPEAVRECHQAGLRVMMITGDYAITAQSVAEQVGLEAGAPPITGPELAVMSDAELRARLESTRVFARIVPEQKLRLVEALKENGEIVAMTGDGVNDAPALKAAHIGIAMGGRGADVAREASDLVLLDDDFSSLVAAVRLGRRIFDNIRKAMAYILAIHVPIAGMSLAPVLLHWPLVLMPVHIVFLELVIDPACSVAFEAEPEDAEVMRRPPRRPGEPVLSPRALAFSLLQGLSVFAMVLLVYAVALLRGQGPGEARALTFTTLVFANLGLILTNLSWAETIPTILRRPNPALWWVLGGALTLLALVLSLPPLRQLFRFAPLHLPDLVLCAVAAAVSVAWFEVVKLIAARRSAPEGRNRTPSFGPAPRTQP